MPRQSPGPDGAARRFACTSCGKCCDCGPEMELSEATALAATFVTSLMFRAHSVPLDERCNEAKRWWRDQGSRIPLHAAFHERRRHTALFASRRRSDRRSGREIYLEISAIVDDYGGGKCPALAGDLCSIYEHRPLTCRTVPLHYSRQPSVLQRYLDKFTATHGYECDTTNGPVILNGSNIVSPELSEQRARAVAVARADRNWKAHLLSFMDDPNRAASAGLPTYDAVVASADSGYATLLPIIVAWRVAEYAKIISPDEMKSLCQAQIARITAEMARTVSAHQLRELLPLYKAGAAGIGSL